MEIRVALCDDEETVREYLGRLLEEWKERQNDQLQIEYFRVRRAFSFNMKKTRDGSFSFLISRWGR